MEEIIASIFIGFGLAAAVGFRVFLPLFVLSLAASFQVIPLNQEWEWLQSNTAMFIFGVATLVEIVAFYIPWLDNLLDNIALPFAAIAGTMVMASTITGLDPTWVWALSVIAGGGTATLFKGSNAITRLASTGATGGLGNPAVTTVETTSSVFLSLLSIYIWPLAVIVVFILFLFILYFYRRILKRNRHKNSS